MLANYNSSNKQNWQSKDAALYLVTSLATKAKTEKHGITKTNALVDLGSFATENVVPELQIQNPAEVNTAPVLKVNNNTVQTIIFYSILKKANLQK